VSGNATLRVAPDEAFITFTITSQQPTAAQAKTIVTDATRSVMGRVLEVEGVTEENVSTDSLQLQPRWESRRRFDGTYETKITGYEYTNRFTIQLDTTAPATLAAIVDGALEAGGDHLRLEQLGFRISNEVQQQKMDEARGLAAKDALGRARRYLEAMGSQVGPLLSVSESPIAMSPIATMATTTQYMQYDDVELEYARSAASMVPVLSGDQDVVANVYAVFAIC